MKIELEIGLDIAIGAFVSRLVAVIRSAKQRDAVTVVSYLIPKKSAIVTSFLVYVPLILCLVRSNNAL